MGVRNLMVIAVIGLAAAACGGEASYDLVDVVGMSAVEAETSLTEAGWVVELAELSLRDIDPELHEGGTVVAQDPEAADGLAEKVVVTLTVVPDFVVVPDLAGFTRPEATARLESTGIDRFTFDEVATADTPDGQVHATTPKAGSVVAPDAAVTVRVAVPVTHTIQATMIIEPPQWEYVGDLYCDTVIYPNDLKSIEVQDGDGNVLGAARLATGTVTENVHNVSASPACRWDVTFANIPEVATYRLNLPHRPNGYGPTVGLADLRGADWILGMYLKAG